MRRVLDCFFLDDELELLEAHLRVLDDVVDLFVVVEGDRTFAGEPRVSVFDRQRFAPWSHKIDHLVVPLPAVAPRRWDRENAQRAGLGARVAELAGDDDLVIQGDVDEVVDPEVVRRLRDGGRLAAPLRLCLDHACWYADWLLPRPWTNGPIAFHLAQRDDPVVRLQLGDDSRDTAEDWRGHVEQRVGSAGLHLWNVLPPAAVRRKWSTYSHVEHDDGRFSGGAFLELCRAHGVSPEGRWLVEAVGERGPLLAALAAVAPGLFAVRPLPALPRRQEVAAYAWARTRLPVPAALWAPVDRWPTLLRLAGPLLRRLDAALRRRRDATDPDADDRWASAYASLDDVTGAA